MANSNVPNGPHSADGWDGFLEDEDDVWYEAFETTEDEDGNLVIDVDHYGEFANIQELVNFVAGQGSYEDTRGFEKGEYDKSDRLREMHNDRWKIPDRLEDVQEYLQEGAMRGEIDIDPSASTGWSVTEQEARMDGKDTKYTAHFIAYADDESEKNADSNFYIAASWYDTPPEEVNVEDVFDLESISDELDEE